MFYDWADLSPTDKYQHEHVALLREANTVAGTEIEPQLADPAANRMQSTHRPPHLDAQSEPRVDSGFRVPVLYPAEPLAVLTSLSSLNLIVRSLCSPMPGTSSHCSLDTRI